MYGKDSQKYFLVMQRKYRTESSFAKYSRAEVVKSCADKGYELLHKHIKVVYTAVEGNDRTRGEGNMKDEQRELIEEVFFPLWDKWTEELKGDADEMMRLFAQRYGCTEKSPLSLMFFAFCGGVDEGFDLSECMNKKRSGKEHSQIADQAT